MDRGEKNRGLIRAFFGDAANYKKLLALCRKDFTDPDDAQDALHTLYIRLYEHAGTCRFPEDPEQVWPYMVGVIRNYCNDIYRQKGRRPVPVRGVEPPEPAADETLPYPPLEEVNTYVHTHEDCFTPGELEVWDLKRIGCTTKEMQQALHTTSNTIYVTYNHLVHKIQAGMYGLRT